MKNKNKFGRWAPYLGLTLGLTGLGMWIFRIIQNINQPTMEYGEGFIVYLAKLVQSGQFHYMNITSGPPFQVNFYTPLFYLVMGHAGATVLAGRVIILACTLISLLLVFLIVYHVTKNKLLSLIASLLPLTQYIMIQWTLILKTDMLAVMFELAGIYLALRLLRSWYVLLSIPLFLLAFYSKQSYFIGPIAVTIALVFISRPRALIYPGVTALALILSLAIFQRIYGDEFIRQIFLLQRTSPMFLHPMNYLTWLMLDYWPLLTIGIGGLFFAFRQPRNLLVIFAALVLVLNLFLVARSGSSQAYQFEVIFAVCIIGGIGYRELVLNRQRAYLVLFLVIPLISLAAPTLVIFPEPGFAERSNEAEAIIADADYPVLTENAGIVVNAGKDPYLCDPFMFMNYTNSGIWDETQLLQDLETNLIPYVITEHKLPERRLIRCTESVQRAILDHYHIIKDYSDYKNSFVIYKANKED